MIIGYARVSTTGQANGNSLEEQIRQIRSNYPGIEVVSETYSGAKERPVFSDLVSKLQKDDMLVVTKLDRFCRQTKEGLEYLDKLSKKGVKVHILNMGLIDNSPMGRLICTNLLAFAEFERQMILERTRTGKEIAREKEGWKEGRPALVVDEKLFKKLLQQTEKKEITVKKAVEELGISRKSWYNLKERIC